MYIGGRGGGAGNCCSSRALTGLFRPWNLLGFILNLSPSVCLYEDRTRKSKRRRRRGSSFGRKCVLPYDSRNFGVWLRDLVNFWIGTLLIDRRDRWIR